MWDLAISAHESSCAEFFFQLLHLPGKGGLGDVKDLHGQWEAEQVEKEKAGAVSLRKITIEHSPLL